MFTAACIPFHSMLCQAHETSLTINSTAAAQDFAVADQSGKEAAAQLWPSQGACTAGGGGCGPDPFRGHNSGRR